MKVRTVVKEVGIGALTGVVYYVAYVLLLPSLLTRAFNVAPLLYARFPAAMYVAALCLFIGLGTATSLLKNHPLSAVLKLLSKVIGALLLLAIMNFGKLEGTIPLPGYVVGFKVDVSVLLYGILLFSMLLFP